MIEWWCHEKLPKGMLELLPESTRIMRNNDMWKIDRFAINFLKSDVETVDKAAENTDKNTKSSNSDEIAKADAEKVRIAKRENLSPNTARETEPGNEASTCASGSQIEKGNSGTFAENIKNTSVEIVETEKRKVEKFKENTKIAVEITELAVMIKKLKSLRKERDSRTNAEKTVKVENS